MYKNRFRATDMFVLIASKYIMWFWQHMEVNNLNVNNYLQMRQTRHFSCKSVKNLFKCYKMIQNNQCIFPCIDFHFIIRGTIQRLWFSSAVWPKTRHVTASKNRIYVMSNDTHWQFFVRLKHVIISLSLFLSQSMRFVCNLSRSNLRKLGYYVQTFYKTMPS